MAEKVLDKAIILDRKMRCATDLDPAKIIEPVVVEDADTGEHTLRFDYPIDEPGGNVRRLTEAPWDGCELDHVEIDGKGRVQLEAKTLAAEVEREFDDKTSWETGALDNAEIVDGKLRLGHYYPIQPLYDGGNEYSALTGGWSQGGYTRGNATVTKGSTTITLAATQSGNQTASVLTNNKIDITNYSKVILYASFSGSGSDIWSAFTLVSTRATTGTEPAWVKRINANYTGGSHVIEMNVEGLTGSYYVDITIDTTSSATQTIIISKVEMVRSTPAYLPAAFWLSPAIPLTAITDAATSLLQAIATVPSGTSLTLYAGLSESAVTLPATWAAQVSGQPMTIITPGDNYSDKFVWLKIELETEDTQVTPEISSLLTKITQDLAYYSSGVITLPPLDLSAAHRIARAAISIEAEIETEAGQLITAELSFDNGETWQEYEIEYGKEVAGLSALTRLKLETMDPGTSPVLKSVEEMIYTTAAAAQLEPGNTVIIPDPDGDMVPFVIRESEIIGAGGQVIRRAICAHLFYELGDGPVRAYSLTNATPATAISAALAGTRWSAGDVDPELLTLTKDFDTDYLNSLEMLRLVEKEFDAQLKFRVEIDGAGITGNTISAYLVDLIAPDEIFSGKRFEFGHDLQRIKIVVDHSQVKTALFGHALGEEIDPLTGDPLPLTFEGEEWSRAAGDPADKPRGQDWVGNEEARKLYGIYDPATGERLHRYGKHESEAESAGELLENTWLIGERYHFRPLVSIEGDVADLEGVKIVSVEDEQGPEIAYDRKSMAVHPSTGVEVPSDTPIFLPFAGGKQGLLIEEGVKNLLTANQSSFETSSTTQAAMRCAHERSNDWSKHGNYSQKVIRGDDSTADAYMWYRCSIAGQGFAAGTLFVAQAVLYLPSGCWYIGKDINFRMRFAGGVQATGALTSQTFTLHEGENLLWVAGELDYSDRQWIEYFIWEVGAGHRAPGETVFYTDCHMGYAGSYLLSWAPGGEPRVGARAYTEPPEPLPPEFGIGLAVKMLHDSAVKDRAIWQAGGYTCFYDTAASKIKITNGVVAAEVPATWSAGDIIAIYAGRCDGKLFIQGKIAGVTTDLVKVTGDALSGVEEITIGSSSGGSGSGHVNGVITDFTYHDDPALVNPAGYFAKITGGGA